MFSLIGPKRYDAPWRDIEAQGWIVPAACTEVRVTLSTEERMAYALAEPGGQLLHRPAGGRGGRAGVGHLGSRQEEAQRLGRILRPKADGRAASFYAVVARDTNDQEFAANRQRFLAEQGYAYEIVDAEAITGA